jgi:hypothetical protein
VPGDPRLTNTIVQLIFRSPGFTIGTGSGTTTGKVEFLPETAAYLNDGFGTKAELAMFGSSIEMGDTPGSTLQDNWREAVVTDNVGPAPFGIAIEKIPGENGKYFAIFNTTDKQTGIDQYQILEEPIADRFSFIWGRANAPWITARSPYELKDQSLNSTVYVKAIDKAGNEYIAKLVPEKALSTIPVESMLLYGALSFLAVMALVVIVTVSRIFIKRRKKSEESGKSEETEEEDKNEIKI